MSINEVMVSQFQNCKMILYKNTSGLLFISDTHTTTRLANLHCISSCSPLEKFTVLFCS